MNRQITIHDYEMDERMAALSMLECKEAGTFDFAAKIHEETSIFNDPILDDDEQEEMLLLSIDADLNINQNTVGDPISNDDDNVDNNDTEVVYEYDLIESISRECQSYLNIDLEFLMKIMEYSDSDCEWKGEIFDKQDFFTNEEWAIFDNTLNVLRSHYGFNIKNLSSEMLVFLEKGYFEYNKIVNKIIECNPIYCQMGTEKNNVNIINWNYSFFEMEFL